MKITWFQPTLVHLDIAIMVELGKRHARDRARHDQCAAADGRERPGAPQHGRAGPDRHGPVVRRDRCRARRFAAGAEVRAHRRDGDAREHGARPAQLRDGGRRIQSALRAAGELPDAQAHHDRAGVGQQPAADVRSLFRDHVQHDPVRRAGGAVCRGVRVQHRRRHRLRRADPPAAVPPDRGLQCLGAAQARLAQPVQAVGDRDAGRAAAAAHQRQGVVRDLLVRLHDPLRQDAHLGREAAVAARRRCTRRAADAR